MSLHESLYGEQKMTRFFGFGALLAIVLSVSGCLCGRGGPGFNCKSVGDQCGGNAECCSFGCSNDVCVANPLEGGICASSSDCRSGLRCDNQSCTAGCRAPDEACRSDWDCCSGDCNATGGNEGVCVARTTCGDQGQSCQTSNDCCSGLQCGSANTCQPLPCKNANDACGVSGDCCTGLGCQNGATCAAGCQTSYDVCASDNDCCSGYDCRGGTCYSRSSCGGDGNTCDNDADCCSSHRCGADKRCRQGQLGEACNSIDQCDDWYGLVCTDGVCHYPANQCRTSSAACALDADCCTSVAAGPGTASCAMPTDGGITGVCCLPGETTCTPSGMRCCGDSVCLSGTGKCGACLAAGAVPANATECCSKELNYNQTPDTCCNDLPSACTTAAECCTNRCSSDGQCCLQEGSVCTAAAGTRGTCCAGSVCAPGYPGATYNTCQIDVGSACTSGSCVAGSTCFGGSCCQDVGATCDGASDCCSGVCGGDGKCAAAAPGGPCRVVNDCGGATANTCTGNTCCRNLGAACGGDTDCCTATGVTCGGATTGGLRCCLPAGATGTALTCCSGSVTGQGRCQ